ncbi:DUF2730 family protein [Psychromonas sp. MME2]|uniref:DUF2730 family protein n=1 Tax=unclassified Psychromonas TaxID=2614957 RepID=UPI00339C6A7E
MFEFIGKYWVQIYALLSVIFYGTTWAMRKTYASKTHVDDLERRITQVVNDVKQLPTDKDMHQLALKIVEIGGKMDGVSVQLSKLQRTTEMLVENEIQGEKR